MRTVSELFPALEVAVRAAKECPPVEAYLANPAAYRWLSNKSLESILAELLYPLMKEVEQGDLLDELREEVLKIQAQIGGL